MKITRKDSLRFSFDRRGREVAHIWRNGREFRVRTQQAKNALAAGECQEAIFGPALLKAGVVVTARSRNKLGTLILATAFAK